MYHYVYMVFDEKTGEYYIGVRSSHCEPVDDPYKGSMVSWQIDEDRKNKLTKKIIEVFKTRTEAEKYESCAIEGCIYDHLNRNFNVPNGYWSGYKNGLNNNYDELNEYMNWDSILKK